ncbi:VanZ family protein [Paenibacillus sp. IHBB 10380]|uniref:VanZ family protein n=1 Tax=Paenibacillus sp. IHBB 10380 TaxID=1566358 RepID=UPI0006991366|nr:VanZ family protein [Paenibacillus sp. IHBB 10380]
MKKRTSKFLYIVISMIFIVYLLVLLRVILFKDAPLYNLFAGIGIGARALNLIPFASMIDMITDSIISLIRLAQNIMGNIVLFIPLGIFLPLLYKRNNKAVLLSGVGLSLLFEIVQFIFAIGSSDIDDIILNVLGTIAGLYIYRIIERILHNRIQILVTVFVLFLL